MFPRKIASLLLLCVFLAPTLALGQQPAAAPAKDPNDPIERIKDEGMNRSQVMQTLSYLSDVIGPRLTGSPGLLRANNWTKDQLTKWGLQNSRLEAWGPFGRGWTLESFSAEVSSPLNIPLIAYPKAWSPGTNGLLTADVVYLEAKDEADLAKYRGQLRGKIVLASNIREIKANFEPQAVRDTEKDLLDKANAPRPGTRTAGNNPALSDRRKTAELNAKKYKFIQDEDPAMIVDISRVGDGGTVFVQGLTMPVDLAPAAEGSFPQPRIRPQDKNLPKVAPQIVLAAEQYNRLVRMLKAGEEVKISTRIDVKYYDQDLMAYNTIAEIPGSDLKDEIVMLGGHIDSWHAGTGATDNAAGVAVCMEAVRILKALGLQPRRTIRIGLWSGEEQGLMGSRAYVAQHFGKMEEQPVGPDGKRPAPKFVAGPEYDKFSGYFNLDNGTGKIRGVYLQGNESVRWQFAEWLTPFRLMGAETITVANTTGTDHQSFDAIGLPGFQFIQDEIEYDTRTHHSNMDVFDRIQAADMQQAAVIMAAFVYQTAMLDQKLTRKPRP